jgi:HK97 family phage major capsid protein
MLTLPSLKHARQAKADNDNQQARNKAEALALLDVPRAQRTPEQNSRIDELTADQGRLAREAVEITDALVKLTADEQEVLKQSTLGRENARPGGRKFAELFPDAPMSMHGWNSAGEFLTVVGRGLHDPRLFAASMSTGVGEDGGYAVPPAILGQWLDTSLESEIVRSRATVWPMTTDTRVVPAWDLMDRSGDDVAGFEIQWTPELGEINLQVGKVRKIKLVAKKGAILAEASEELRADGLTFDAQLNQILVKAFSYGMDRSFLRGTGSGQPLGVLNSSALVTVTKETSQSAATISYINLTKMFARMPPASVPTSVWVANTSTIPALTTLSLPMGTAGAHIPVMTESNGQFRILTRPVIFTDKVPTLGNVGDIGLYDFTQYTIGMRQEVTIDRSAHVGFSRDAMTYRLKVRLDGQPNISTPYVQPNSAPALSPFVVLETRG